MLTLIFIISIITILILYNASDNDICTIIMFIIGFISFIIFTVLLVAICSYPHNIDKKIAMYQEENVLIEEKVKNTVMAYIDYEQETYDNLVKNADLQTLLITYPELNSNELVKAQIDTYVQNNNKLKELKEKQIDKSTMAWLLYFGK